jgi:hypothetical protein
MNGWFILSAISTGVIAILAISNFILAFKIKARDDESKKILNDLLRALIASNLVQESKSQAGILKTFNALYKELVEGKLPNIE